MTAYPTPPPPLSETHSHQAAVILVFSTYISLAKDQHIPVVADWVVSIIEPIDDLLDMYTTSIQDYERKRKASCDGEPESPDSN